MRTDAVVVSRSPVPFQPIARGQEAVMHSRVALARNAHPVALAAKAKGAVLQADPISRAALPIEGTPVPAGRSFGQADIDAIHSAFGSREGDKAYSSEADVNGDGVVDFRDFTHVLSNWGQPRP